MASLYATGLSSNDIGKMIGREGRTVRTHLAGLGVLRGKREAVRTAVGKGKIRSVVYDAALLDSWSPETAWFLGLLYGDGHVMNDSEIGQYGFSLAGTEEVCGKVATLLKTTQRPRKALHQNCWILTLYGFGLQERLSCYGLTGGSKATTMTFPDVPEEMLPHFIRGLMDSDGSWHKSGRNASYACSSIASITALRGGLSAHGILTRLSEHVTVLGGKSFLGYVLGINKGPTERLATWLYADTSDPIRCARKFGQAAPARSRVQ